MSSDRAGTEGRFRSRNRKDGRPYRVTELFSGIGAQRMSLIQEGIPHEVVGTSEIDRYAIRSYEAIYGDNPNLGDITRLEGIPESDILTYSFPCFTGDATIRTERGLVPIKDVSVGDRVLSHDNRWHRVTGSWKTGTESVCVFKPACGEPFRCTPEHRLYVRRMHRVWNGTRQRYERVFDPPEWIPASDAVGHYVGFPVPTEKPIPEWDGIDFQWSDGRRTGHVNRLSEHLTDPSFWWTVGRYIADGWQRCRGGIVLAFGKGKEGQIANIYETGFTVAKERNVLKVHIPQREVGLFCSQFGSGAAEKHIPEKYMGLPRELAKAMLDGYLAGDGCLLANGWCSVSTVSRELAYDLARLIAYVHHCPANITFTGNRGKQVIEGRVVDTGGQFMVKFHPVAGPQEQSFYEDGWIWSPLRFKRVGGTEDVYDLEVEGSHSFIVNGIVAHNCTDLSGANPRRTGMAKGANKRSSLLWEVQRLLDDAASKGTLPRWLIMENVPAVFSKANRRDFDEWVAYLGSLGYTSEYGTLNARDFGVPQNRNRAYMISHLGDHCPRLPVGNASGRVLGDVLEDDIPEKYYLSKARLKGLEDSNRKEIEAGNGFRFRPKTPDEVASTVTTRAGSRKTDNFVYDQRCHRIGTAEGIKGFDCIRRVYGTDGLSPTPVTGSGGNHLPKISPDGARIRKLTPRETWRLQGFPDWAFDRARDAGMSDTQLYHQSGNSIAVPVMGAIMRTIDDYETAESEGRAPKRMCRVTLDDWGTEVCP